MKRNNFIVQATFKFSRYHGEESARTLCPRKTIFFDLIFSSQLPNASLHFYLTLIKITCKQKTAFMQKKLSLFPAVPFFFVKKRFFRVINFNLQVVKRTLLSNFEVDHS